MIYSMTAFARRENRGQWGEITWELRSVNHRYLDVTLRLPEDLRALEPAVRDRVRDRVGRGKLECLLRYRPAPGRDTAPRVDLNLAEQVVEAIKEISQFLPGTSDTSSGNKEISPMEILKWPGVVETPVPDPGTIGTPILDTLDEALAELAAARSREGEKLTALITSRCREASAIAGQVRKHVPSILAGQRARLLERLSEIQAGPNPERLEQELVFFAQKTDVAEELDRLDTHLSEVQRILEGEVASGSKKASVKNPMGRRLDFLIQEMHREANTLSAKSVDKEVTSASVELRVLIEQMREQVQNIE